MNVIYLRTFFVSYVLFIALCVIVIASLWWPNRKRSPEIFLWLVNYVLLFIALLLITLRGLIPDLFSIVLANFFIIGGAVILYIGLGRYLRKEIKLLHNVVMLAIFTLVHAFLTYAYPNAAWRTINQSIALIYICAQASWLMLRGVDKSLRPATRSTGIVFALFCLIGMMQIIVNFTIHESHHIIVSGSFGIVATMMYQISFVALTLALFLMVSRRLSAELENELVQRGQEEKIIRIRLSLLEFATNHSLEEVLQKTLDEIGVLLDSPVGFYHFVEEDQRTLRLQAWSTRTVKEFCKAEGKGMHYNIDQAGVWVDCIYQKRAVIHNDYYSLPHRKGLPVGHAPVIRELVVPIMRGERIMAILGIGNKPTDYTEKDAEIVSYLADVAWEIIKHKQSEDALKKSEEQVRLLLNSTAEAIYGIDNQCICTFANPSCLKMLGYENMKQLLGKNIHDLIHHSYPDGSPMKIDECAIMMAFPHGGGIHRDDEVFWRADGTSFPVEYWSYPQMVNGKVSGAVVTFIDITERKQVEERIKHLATHDLLTDLPILSLAKDRLSVALNMARRYKKAAAVMFIDLDSFKAVNDTLGHDAGDYVLKQVAQRMLSCVRETDTVARVGGDEFLIIASEINAPENVVQIAEKVIHSVSQPIIFNGHQAIVGTSIGIALFPEHSEDIDKLIKLADEAMYKVKYTGKNNFRFADNLT